MKWRQSPTARLDVTPVRAEGSLTVITVSKMYGRFIRLPPLGSLELVLLAFSLELFRTYYQALVQGL
jgi:hypothetical protein